jgi:hypothetical protein
MNGLDMLLILLVCLALGFAIGRVIRSRGSCSCGESCGCCSMNCKSKKKK